MDNMSCGVRMVLGGTACLVTSTAWAVGPSIMVEGPAPLDPGIECARNLIHTSLVGRSHAPRQQCQRLLGMPMLVVG